MGLPRITRPINTSNVICKAVKHAIEFQMIKLAVWRGCEEKHHIITFCNSQEPKISRNTMATYFPSGLKETAKTTPLKGYTDITAPVESEHKDASPTINNSHWSDSITYYPH